MTYEEAQELKPGDLVVHHPFGYDSDVYLVFLGLYPDSDREGDMKVRRLHSSGSESFPVWFDTVRRPTALELLEYGGGA